MDEIGEVDRIRAEQHTPEAALEILAREMYVADHSNPDSAVWARGQWYQETAGMRTRWRFAAARVRDSLVLSGLDVTWIEDR